LEHLARIENGTVPRDEQIRMELSRIEGRQWDLLTNRVHPESLPTAMRTTRADAQVAAFVDSFQYRTLPDGRIVRSTVCRPVFETMAHAGTATPPEFDCNWVSSMPREAVIQGRIAFNQALAGEQLRALETVRGIVDDWSRGHILAFHVIPLLSEAEHYRAALPVAQSVQNNAGARLNAFADLAVHLESYGLHEKAIEALEESGKAVAEIRRQMELESSPATSPETILPGTVPLPAPKTYPPASSAKPSREQDDQPVSEDGAADSVAEAAIGTQGLHWYQNYLGMLFSALAAYVFAVMKPFFEACFKTAAGPATANMWLGPDLLLLLGFASDRTDVRRTPKVSFLFGEEGVIKQSVQVEIHSAADFHCAADDERVTPEMVKRVYDDIARGVVSGRVDGVEWHRED